MIGEQRNEEGADGTYDVAKSQQYQIMKVRHKGRQQWEFQIQSSEGDLVWVKEDEVPRAELDEYLRHQPRYRKQREEEAEEAEEKKAEDKKKDIQKKRRRENGNDR